MKAAELKKLLKDIPDDTELIVGDLECGQFWNPVINQMRPLTARRVNQDWVEHQLHHVSFFALFNQTPRLVNESTPDVTCPVEVRALSL
jgi:hypothetical protein